jgi:hypothetical protein
MTPTRVLAVLALALVMAGCSMETVHITSNPPGCRVSVDGLPQYSTITPGSISLPVGRDYTLVCQAPDGRTASETIRWTPVGFFERLGITVVLTPVCGLLGVGLVVVGVYFASPEALVTGVVLVIATPFIPIAYIFDTGYFEHGRPRSTTEGPGRGTISMGSSIYFDFGRP